MAYYKGKKKVNTSSYSAFRKETVGNAYDVDGVYKAQCYDLGNLFWINACGRWVVSATKDGGIKGGASGIWGARANNNKNKEFDLITDIKKLKKGDIVITNNGKYGHICFMDENYSSKTYLKVFGQNQGGTGGAVPGAECKTINWNFKKVFLGAFRYKKWNNSTPSKQPTKTYKTVNATAGLNIRKYIGTKNKVLVCIPNKKKVEVLENNSGSKDGYKWSKIKYNNITGYVANKYLK